MCESGTARGRNCNLRRGLLVPVILHYPPPPGMHWKRGRHPPPASRAPSLCPATVPLTASASLNGSCNRQ